MKHLLTALLLLAAVLAQAGDAKHTVTYRVIGLCYPERVDDLRAALKERPVTIERIDFERAELTLTHDKSFSMDNVREAVGPRSFEIRPRSTVPPAQLMRIEILVTGLDCKGCAMGTYYAIGRIDGVEQAAVSYKDGKLSALIDPARTNQGALEEALKRANVTLTGK